MKRVLLLVCVLVCALADLVPHHVYLSLTGESDSFQVTFTTSTLPIAPFAQYWVSQEGPKGAQSIFGDSDSTFTFQNPNSTTIDYITSFTLTNLTRGIFYTYFVCGDAKNQTGTCSSNFTFKSLPNDDDILNIGFFGDLGSNGTALMEQGPGGLLKYAASYSADFIVHNGDLAYNLATDGGVNGNDFLTKMEPITSIIPYVVTPGNHEFKTYADPIYYANWLRGQTLLGQQSGSINPTAWFSFDVGNVHIIGVSTEVYCEDTKNLMVQHQWLEKDLQEVRSRSIQPWVVVFGHRQMYYGIVSTHSSKMMRLGIQCNDSSLQNCDITPCDSGENCGYSMEQLLNTYSADIFISGHVHTYARMYPISNQYTYELQNESFYINSQHPTYLISGAPGIQSAYSVEEAPEVTFPGDNIVKTVTGYSFSHMQVFNSTHLFIKQINATSGDIVDSFWIIKDSSLPKWDVFDKFPLLPSLESVCD